MDHCDLKKVNNCWNLKNNFYLEASVANFTKLFWHNLCDCQCIAVSFDLGYAAWGVIYTGKGFMKLTSGDQNSNLHFDTCGLYYKTITIVI